MAYGAVTSLLQCLDDVSSENPCLVIQRNDQFESLYEKLKFLQAFLGSLANECNDHDMVKILVGRIRNVANTAQDVFEEFVSINAYNCEVMNIFDKKYGLDGSLSQIVEEIDSIRTAATKIHEEADGHAIEVIQEGISSVGISSQYTPISEDPVVGLDDDLMKLKDRLTGLQLKLEIVSIVGMGGIGKTTLARMAFQDSLISYHFYVRAWATVSQEYQPRDVLLSLLSTLPRVTGEICGMSVQQLSNELYRSLKGNRYLIVIDDIWSTKAWSILRRSFPDDKNGSRIILTTRLSEVALHANPNSPPLQMSLLSLDRSWELLCRKVFVKESCPEELVNIGEEIAEKCQGLPLGILLVAGHLSKISKTPVCWRNFVKTVHALLTGDQEKCLDIFALSYNYLPDHLKPCFLYMGAFPEDMDIPVWKLIRVWVAEGFLQPKWPKSSEEMAEECLDDLISRNLVMVKKRRSDGRVKTCGVHDLVREFSTRQAEKENFLHSRKFYVLDFPAWMYNQRRLSLHSGINRYASSQVSSLPLTRSLICFGKLQFSPSGFYSSSVFSISDLKLLRVLDMAVQCFEHFPVALEQLVHLRYLLLPTRGYLPGSLSRFCFLQTLVNEQYPVGELLPVDIWEMLQARHLYFKRGTAIPDPVNPKDVNRLQDLPNLQTLASISFSSCTKEVFTRLPSLKTLGIQETAEDCTAGCHISDCFENFIYLKNLEALKFSCIRPQKLLPHWDAFPSNLKKLTLSDTHLPWTVMSTLAMLSSLEVLKLKNFALEGPEWKQTGTGFSRLKYFLLENSDLVHWRATCIPFLSLQCLVLKFCYLLRKIPHIVGEIPTLQFIQMIKCSHSAYCSATEIQQVQQSLGNDGLEVLMDYHISSKETFPWDRGDYFDYLPGMEVNWEFDIFEKVCLKRLSQGTK